MTTVTRLDIADLVSDAFGPSGATRDEILATAARNGAAPVVIERLATIPAQRFRTMRDLWVFLPEVEVE